MAKIMITKLASPMAIENNYEDIIGGIFTLQGNAYSPKGFYITLPNGEQRLLLHYYYTYI